VSITYVKGDATRPVSDGNKIIVHVCNDVGAWGAGFVMALSARWPYPESCYRNWKRGIADAQEEFELGGVQLVRVEADIWVINMIAQTGLHAKSGEQPIRYSALQRCLQRVAMIAQSLSASIHMPRIGCGLAGGKWELVEKIIEQELAEFNVTVYDLN
jgi:O-acetyl-ADP-ribose deacetylase (regulator of RNase III)